ncbi:MAG: GYF domain-containing protein, partial [Bacteriovoracales bacterium]
MLAENLNYSELNWFLLDGAIERGPFLTSEMLYKYKKGNVTNFTKVKNENMDYWIPYN